jgi:hypothetical protein
VGASTDSEAGFSFTSCTSPWRQASPSKTKFTLRKIRKLVDWNTSPIKYLENRDEASATDGQRNLAADSDDIAWFGTA